MAEKEFYVHIDFNGQIDASLFNTPDVYLKLYNLHRRNPTVQVNNYLFQGQYKDCLGTNVYYQEVNPTDEENPFKAQTSVSLQYVAKSNKVLELKVCKLPENVNPSSNDSDISLQLSEDYASVIKKLKRKGSLNIEDIVDKNKAKKDDAEKTPAQDLDTSVGIPPETEPLNTPMVIDDPVDMNLDYVQVLKDLAKQPMKTDIPNTDEVVIEPSDVKPNNLNYLILKQLYLQKLEYRNLPLHIDETKLHLYVDIEASMKNGIVKKSNFQKLTEEEKCKLISLDNLENLSPPLQFALLVHQLKEEKRILSTMSDAKLQETDKYGRTCSNRYRILKSFAKDIWYHMYRSYL